MVKTIRSKTRMIDFKLITFLTVVKVGSFTRAANVLNLTQPAISQHIKYIENYYGVELFKNKNKNMELTEEGKVLYKYGRQVENISNIVHMKLKNSINKRYVVGATLTIGGYVIPSIIGKYKKEHNDIDVILKVENTDTVIKMLYKGEIELGVIEGGFSKEKIEYTKFKEDELVLVVSPNHKFADKNFVNIEEILQDKLILREDGSGTRQIFEEHLIEMGIRKDDYNIYMEIGNISAIVSLVKSNLGCTIISREAVKENIEEGSLKEVQIENFNMRREFNFIYLKDGNERFIKSFTMFCKENDI
ncbi:LysR family transcriptional regulator [Clostridium tetani]|uniref:Transcriptional regulatory protein n=2 Tax=Clostridium tetani TaxID=1513 RepID=Q895Q9_CLOTE|nr:transcriptional regulatory protein [Clostridium tetani E88]RXI63049.1 LysR family transcriptional regulator [Clostridium tetani]RXI63571.1 LysR family transcriptional regulator [Clostridium tetani]RXI66389.1 LysR family transcriptional regulator [Clostridium tetani]RXI72420.1 LysR family transcriptional regulator [Clostridium tetani]